MTHQILRELKAKKFIDCTWKKYEKKFIISLLNNDVQYIEENWKKIKASRIQDIFIISAESNINQKIFELLHKVWILDKNYENSSGDNSFMIACACGNLNKAKYLIDIIAMDPNHKNKKGDNALIISCRMSNLEMIKYLIHDLGMDPNHCNNEGDNCLLQATRNNNLDILKYLINMVEMDKNCTNLMNENILTMCCSHNNLKMIRYIVNDLAMNTNHFDKDENNCLSYACKFNNNLDVIKYLVHELKFDIHQLNDNGYNSIMTACQYNSNYEIVKYLIDMEKNQDPHHYSLIMSEYLRLACRFNNNLSVIIKLIKYNGEQSNTILEKKDIGGDDCLLSACRGSNLCIIKYLINCLKMDTRIKDCHGNNCVMVHCRGDSPNIRVVKYLIKDVGLNVNEINAHGRNAFSYSHNEDIIKYLINEAKTDVKIEGIGAHELERAMRLITDYKRYNELITNGLSIFHEETIKAMIRKRNPFKLSKYYRKKFKINPFIEEDYTKCIGLIDRLTEKVSIPNLPKIKVNKGTIKISTEQKPELLFRHNGNDF